MSGVTPLPHEMWPTSATADVGRDREHDPLASPRGSHRIGLMGGGSVDILAPDWRDFTLAHVGHGLRHINRFNGQLARPVSVLYHSLTVAELAPRPLRLAALLHDGKEFLTGDLTRPFKRALGTVLPDFEQSFDAIERRIDSAIVRRALGEAGFVPHSNDVLALIVDEMRCADVRAADNAAALWERRMPAPWPGPDDTRDPFERNGGREADDGYQAMWLSDVIGAVRERFAPFLAAKPVRRSGV